MSSTQEVIEPKALFYPEKNFKGEETKLSKGEYLIDKENFTQNELIGKTFYIISSKLSNDGEKYAIDTGGYSGNCDGNNCFYHLWKWDKTNQNQIFTMLKNGVIKNIANGYVMTVNNFENGEKLRNYPENDKEGQLWSYDSKTRYLKVRDKDFIVGIAGDEIKNGSSLVLWEPNGDVAQLWNIQLCDIKDNFKARERFALRFYDPVPSMTKPSSPNQSLSLVRNRESFTNRCCDVLPSIRNDESTDAYTPKSLYEQNKMVNGGVEKYETCLVKFFDEPNRKGNETKWFGIGDYDISKTSDFKNDVISSSIIMPYTDLIIYEHANFGGKVKSIHNGMNTILYKNFADSDVGMDNMVSSFKIRAAAMDNDRYATSKDMSDSSVCNIKYKVFDGQKWSNYYNNGEIAGKIGNKIYAISFEYSGPGQLKLGVTYDLGGGGTMTQTGCTSGDIIPTDKRPIEDYSDEGIEKVEMKIDDVSNVNIGIDICDNLGVWSSMIGNGTKTLSVGAKGRHIELIKLTVSLDKITAITNSGKVVSLANFPNDWSIIDLSPGKFTSLVGKQFIIKSRNDDSFVMGLKKRLLSAKNVVIVKRDKDEEAMKAGGEVWSVDKYGRLWNVSSDKGFMKVDNTRNGSTVRYYEVGDNHEVNVQNYTSLLSKWRLGNKGQICSINQEDQVMTVKDGNMSDGNGVELDRYTGLQKYQYWDIEVLGEGGNKVKSDSDVSVKVSNESGKNTATKYTNSQDNSDDSIDDVLIDDNKKITVLKYAKSSEFGVGNIITGRWKQSNAEGIFYFTFNENYTEFSGKWGYNDKRPDHDCYGKSKEGLKGIYESNDFPNMKFSLSGNSVKGTYEYRDGTIEGVLNESVQVLLSELPPNSSNSTELVASPDLSTNDDVSKVVSTDDNSTKTKLESPKNQMLIAPQTESVKQTLTVPQTESVKPVKLVKPPSKFSSFKVKPLTDLIIYEMELDKSRPVKVYEFHNGSSVNSFDIKDFSEYGASSEINKYEVKECKNDGKMTVKITEHKAYEAFHKDGKIDWSAIGKLIIILIVAFCILYYIFRQNGLLKSKPFFEGGFLTKYF